MKVTMKTLAAGPRGVFDADKAYDLPSDLARQFQEFWGDTSAAQEVPEQSEPDEEGKPSKRHRAKA